ncbi:(2Fe-2S)-binding protein [Paenibacillus sp. J31TS4]|uniref:Rieske (2Fe-2S) protein n=1 Tax=Paenibacillus sp. J31TS4 TaxID=2807195 RepID=UPI001B175BA2|nr:Rieske (2Fe-2S) protein [Paenibacillus sp. J31TS4]GIP37805.1 (2Fe-2S)-binding protein [Paenibacillus sp. J31TS4]
MAIHYVLKEGDLADGGHAIVTVNGREIGIYRRGEAYYALYNYCPHLGAPLCSGRVCGTNLPSDVYRYEYGMAGEIVRCPWHGWEFEIATGKSLFSDKVRAKTYPVEVHDGQIGVVLGR